MKLPIPAGVAALLCTAATFLPAPRALAEAQPSNAAAHQTASYTLVPVTDKTDPGWLAQARASYPLTTCSVSGDKLEGGDMGKPLDYIYEQPGRPNRLVRFCCKDCLKDFRKNPTKYLKAIDDAAAKRDAKRQS
jgi:hypothetical protein